MYNLFLQGGELDINGGQSVQWNYTPVRFMEDLTDQFTTDFELPNNRHNIQLLQASGLLDSDRRFSSRLEPALLSLNGEIINVYLQVASIDDDKISVCVYEKTIPADILNKKLIEFNKDSNYTIFPWKKDSWSKYPSVYKKYNNGLYGRFDYAMFHQSRKVNDVIDIVGIAEGLNIMHTDDQLWMTATEKNVCPQNTHQVLEVNFTDGEWGQIVGGQHVANDAEWKWSGGEDTITFNRQCNVTMKIYVSYSRGALSVSGDHFLLIDFDSNRPQTPHQAEIVFLPTTQHYNDIVTATWTLPINYVRADTTMKFRVQGANSFRFISCVIDMTITDYDIMEDDYSINLTYVARDPRMRFRNYTDNTERYMVFNGTSQPYIPYSGGNTKYFLAPDLSIAHLGFWCNLPDVTLKELLYGLQWLTRKRFWRDKWIYDWADIDVKYKIDGVITKFETTNDKLGQKNHLVFAGEGDNNENVVSSIDNSWLESNVDVHTSPFTYSLKRNGNWAYYPQYKDPKEDEETGEYSASFDSVDGLAISKIVPTTPNLLLRVVLPTLGFNEITESTTVEIETFDSVRNADYVYLHGRKFMVQSIDTDLSTGLSTIKAIEVWKQNPPSEIKWPPRVSITDIFNILEHSAQATYTIEEQ